jgi:hypothetical protein
VAFCSRTSRGFFGIAPFSAVAYAVALALYARTGLFARRRTTREGPTRLGEPSRAGQEDAR